MARRRRKKIAKPVRRRLPQVFVCPKCGGTSVKVFMDSQTQTARVVCSLCSLKSEMTTTSTSEPVDVYSKFSDLFYSGAIS
ncbi:MAG: hypothetical protein ACE5PO_01795 [Candidatus Bathyarchaeia archaeon]